MKENNPVQATASRFPYLMAAATLGVLALWGVVTVLRSPQPKTHAEAQAEAPPADVSVQTAAVEPDAEPEPAKPEVIRTDNSPLSDVELSFKLDPRLTRSLYMGDRWVSPPTYTRVGEASGCTAEIKAQGVDAQGKPINVTPQWTVADPTVAMLSTSQGNAISLTAQRPGQTGIELTAFGFTKRLAVSVAERDGLLIINITQPEVKRELVLSQTTPAYTASVASTAPPGAVASRRQRHHPGRVALATDESDGAGAQNPQEAPE